MNGGSTSGGPYLFATIARRFERQVTEPILSNPESKACVCIFINKGTAEELWYANCRKTKLLYGKDKS